MTYGWNLPEWQALLRYGEINNSIPLDVIVKWATLNGHDFLQSDDVKKLQLVQAFLDQRRHKKIRQQ